MVLPIFEQTITIKTTINLSILYVIIQVALREGAILDDLDVTGWREIVEKRGKKGNVVCCWWVKR